MNVRPVGKVLPLLVAVQFPGSLGAQTYPTDQGVLAVRQAGRVLAREEFALQPDPNPRAPAATTLSVVRTVPGEAPTRLFARFDPRTVTVRIATPAGEVAREYPGRVGVLLVDQELFALHALAGLLQAGRLQVQYPRSGRRESGSLEDRGMERTAIGREQRDLRHRVLLVGEETYHLWFDGSGRLMKVTAPARDLVAERVNP